MTGTVRAPLAAPVLVLVLALVLAPGPSRADDWLAVYPACAQGPDARAPGLMRILYPRPGLPALVHAGDRMVARVRVPSGLTPPPGVQQDRALRHWTAALLGNGVPLSRSTEHRYELRVTDVRPDAGSTLVYRATVPIPVWVAAGTYSLRMTAPGGSEVVVSSVRVVEAGRAPRIALLGPVPADRDPAAMRALLAQTDVDVWVGAAPIGAPRSVALAVLALPAPPVALRVGSGLVVLGRCDDPALPFASQLGTLAALEHRAPREGTFAPMPGAGEMRVVGGSTVGLDPSATATVERLPGGGARVGVPSSAPGDVVLTLLVPNDRRATHVRGASSFSFWPAIPISDAWTTTLALHVVARPGADVHVERSDAAPLRVRVAIEPDPVAAGLPTRLHAVASRHARFLWRHGEDLSAVGPTVVHAYTDPGAQPVAVLAIADDGVAARASAAVHVDARHTRGCAAAQAPPSGRQRWSGAVELLILAILWQIRQVRPRRRE